MAILIKRFNKEIQIFEYLRIIKKYSKTISDGIAITYLTYENINERNKEKERQPKIVNAIKQIDKKIEYFQNIKIKKDLNSDDFKKNQNIYINLNKLKNFLLKKTIRFSNDNNQINIEFIKNNLNYFQGIDFEIQWFEDPIILKEYSTVLIPYCYKDNQNKEDSDEYFYNTYKNYLIDSDIDISNV